MLTLVPSTTGADLLGDYAQHLTALGRSPSTIRCRTEWAAMLTRDTGPPESVTTAEVESWLARHRWSAQTRRIVITSLRQWFAWLVDTGARVDNPAAGLKAPPQPHYAAHPIPEPVLAAAMSRATGATWWLLRVAATTGLRRAELARLRGSDCRDGWLTVLGKGQRERRVPVPPDVAAYLAAHRGVVFPAADGAQRTPVAIGQVIRRATRGYGPHSIRHRYATTVYAAGHDMRAVQELLGHASIATTQLYVQVDAEALQSAASAAWGLAA